MSSDGDKTVFKQPKPGGDRTVMRPSPGKRGGGAQQPSPRRSSSPSSRQTAPAMAEPHAHVDFSDFKTSHGLNPLVNAASTLIAVFEKTRTAASHPNVGAFHKQLVSELKEFEVKANAQGIPRETILSARYLLCSVLDEAVLNTPWGSESPWGQHTLLSVFHKETAGGEKCFMILDRMRERPAENLDILELFYICISLGFEGKYRLISRGRDALEEIRDELFRILRSHRGEYERNLSPNWQGLGNSRNSLAEYIPTWVLVSCVAAILFFGYAGFRYWLYSTSEPVVAELQSIAGTSQEEEAK